MKDEVVVPPINPFEKKAKCKGCGSKEWADATLDARDLKPDSCDRCPQKHDGLSIFDLEASQNIS